MGTFGRWGGSCALLVITLAAAGSGSVGETPRSPGAGDHPSQLDPLPGRSGDWSPPQGGTDGPVPNIDFEPSARATILGGTARFTVMASGDPPLQYQWRKNGVNLFDGGNVSGATTDVLTLTKAQAADAANYSVVVSNGSGSDTSVDAALTVGTPQGGDVDFGFDPGSSINGTVRAIAVQANGKVLIGGGFTSVAGAARSRIARLNADGSTDPTFGEGLSGANSDVQAMALQPDGRVLIGGGFGQINGVNRTGLARLNPNGSLDTTFLNGLSGPNSSVLALALQPDGRVVIGGYFSSVNGVSRNYIARLNADGSLDTTFLNGLAGPNAYVSALALQPDGRVLIAGYFTTVNGVGRSNLARLNPDGSLDTTFLSELSGPNNYAYVSAFAVQPDGRVLIGGYFTTVNGVGRSNLARLNADGSLDTTFMSGLPGVNGSVTAIVVQPDGRAVIAGNFWQVNAEYRNNVARLNTDGSVDTTFLNGLAGASSSVQALALQPDGRPLIGGYFTSVNGVGRSNIARLSADGSLDTSFLNGLAGANNYVQALAVQADGRALLGGYFTSASGAARSNLARLNVDGSLDTTFLNGLSGVSGSVNAIALQPDGRVLIGGGFWGVNGVSRSNVARLNADGSVDTTFLNGMAGTNSSVRALALQPDGRVLIAGYFTTVNGAVRSNLARLNPDGSLDTTFLGDLSAPDNYAHVYALALQPDGRVVIGGRFTTVNGASRNYLARLNSDGSLDTTFLNGLAGPNSYVLSLALQPDGRMLIGGYFGVVNGVNRPNVARLNADGSRDATFLNGLAGPNSYPQTIALQPDGRVLIGGGFTTVNGSSRNYLARLNADGSLDATFLNGLAGANASVYALGLQPDGRVLAGGTFGGVNGVGRTSVVRLYGASPIAPTITVEPTSQDSHDDCCAVFTVAATGTPLDYQWRKDGASLVDGPGISGANAATLRLSGVADADEAAYSVVVSNVLGSETSADAGLTVTPVPVCKTTSCDPVLGCVVSNLPDGTVCDLDADLCATADTCQAGVCVAGGTLVCNDGDVCTDDACNPASGCYTTFNVAPCDDANACTIVDTCSFGTCAGTQDCARIRAEPTPRSTILGGTARFTVIADGTEPIAYAWRKDGVNLSDGGGVTGASTDVLTLTDADAGDEADYSVVVSNGLGSDTSVNAALTVGSPQGGDVDFAFDSGTAINGNVRTIAVQANGKVMLGGSFTSVGGAARSRIARLNADGSTDATFGEGLSGLNSEVQAIAVQPDGGVLIGGYFSTVNGVNRRSLARLNPDGSLDTAFLNGLSGPNSSIYTIAAQPDGRVLIGGSFSSVNGKSRNYLARLNADGSLDTTFLNGIAGPNSSVVALALQPDGRVVIAGGFTSVNGVSRRSIARLNADGSLDATFLSGLEGASSPVGTLALQPDGRVVIGGSFTTINGANRNYIARLNADGSLDTTFLNGLSGPNYPVQALALQPDGRVLIAGYFYSVNGASRSNVARLNANGSLDTTFLNGPSGPNSTVLAIASQPDGRVVIGGYFTTVNGVSRPYVARLNGDGTLNASFTNGPTGVDSTVQVLAARSDGRVLIGGGFTTVGGVSRSGLAQLKVDGSLDTTFLNGLAGVSGSVQSIALQPDGRALIGGSFWAVNGVSRSHVARLNSDGSLDTTFLNGLSGPNSSVLALALQPDGRVVIGGYFSNVNGVSRNYIARLNADGSLDTTFLNGLAGPNSYVRALAVQPDGRVLIGGYFTTVNGVSRNYLARLNANGSLDTTFLNGLAGPNSYPQAFAVQPDGRVLIAGYFSTVNGVSRYGLARLNADGSLDATFLNGLAGPNGSAYAFALQSDGRILLGGSFSTVNGTSRNYLALLNADGSLDTTFLNGLAGPNYYVVALALQPDGRVLAAGGFGGVNGVARTSVARLYGSSAIAPTITVEPSNVGTYDGCCAAFTVQATGTPLNYQWRKDGVDLVDGTGISGANAATLRLTGVDDADEAAYSVVVSNVLGSDTSANAGLTTTPVPPCKVTSCDAVLGCVLSDAPNGTACSDGNACTTGDTCSAGVCTAGSPLVCTDGNACTDDSCNTGTGCVFTNNTSACNDGNACTTGDTCSGGACSGAPLVCNDGNVCTDDACNPATGCFVTNNTASCNDGNACTTGDVCSAGTCSGIGSCATIVSEPTSQATILGGTARFTVIADGTPPLPYQWRKGGVNLANGPGVSGATTDVLTLSGVDAADPGTYSVVVGSPPGTDTSADASLTVGTPQGGDVDFGFGPGASINARVGILAAQPDGKVLIGGTFTSVADAARGRVARLNADGTTDHSFANALAGTNSSVFSAAVQVDGRVLIAGDFTSVHGVGRSYVARLNVDGSLDTTFLNGLAGPNSYVTAIALQSDGRVLLGGDFSTVNGVSRTRIARLNSDGTLDTTFQNGLSGLNSWPYAINVQSDGRVVLGGTFTSVNGVGRNYVARLNANGSLDTTFLSGLSGPVSPVNALAIQSDAKIVIGGAFSLVNGVGRNFIARLNADGSLDTTFLNGLSGANSTVQSVALQPDGRVLVVGFFSAVNGVSRNRIARLNADGSVDTTFLDGLSGANNTMYSVALQPDGRVLVGGDMTSLNGATRLRVARLNADGSLDATFSNGAAGINNALNAAAVQPDGRVLIAGDFTAVDDVGRNRVARLNADGTLDASFLNGLAGASHLVRAMALQPDGQVLIGGDFTTVNGVARGRIARLNVDGTLDTSFLNGLAGTSGTVYSIAVQPDGRVLIGGGFATVNGVSRSNLARLNTDGTLDTTFLNGLAGPNSVVQAFALQPDGKVVIGGGFATVNGASRSRIARLNADGSVDTTFLDGLAGADNAVLALSLEADGRVLIGGIFTTVNGVGRSSLARLNADGSLDTTYLNGLAGPDGRVLAIIRQPDGLPIVGGWFTTFNGVARGRVARLNADGTVDGAFMSGVAGVNGPVNALGQHADGRVVAGGTFGGVNGAGRTSIARLYGSSPIAPTITVEPSNQTSYDACCAVLSVQATGTPLDYQWRKGGVDLADGPGISGANASTLRLTGLDGADAGTYTVVVSNVLGSDVSADAALTVSPIPACKVASCDPVLGCQLSDLPDGTACSDGNACTTGETCSAGVCTSGAPLVCGDGNACTDDSCNPATGCVFANNSSPCDDGNACTTGDACSAGACGGGAPLICSDGNACTDDSCSPASGCAFTNNSAPCDDGITCTTGDVCAAGTCTGIGSCATILFEPSPRATILGGTARFTVIAEGTPPLPYQWRKGGVNLADGFGVGGATTDVLTLTGVDATDAGAYSVVVGSAPGSDTSIDAALTVGTPQGGDVDFGFDAGSTTNSLVSSVVRLADGRFLVGGDFGSVRGAARGRVARLRADGSTDFTFMNGMTGFDASVSALTVQADGKAIVGGNFGSVNGVSRSRIARLNADGSVDTSFLNGLSGTNSPVLALAVQPDGKILIGGTFTTVNGTTRNFVARLLAGGAVDSTFAPSSTGVNGNVTALALQTDGRVVIGGTFTQVDGVSRNGIARLNADGTLDATFLNGLTGANGSVSVVAMQPDGKVLVGGGFTTLNGSSRSQFARLNADGSTDATFLNGLSGANNNVFAFAVQSDGDVVIGGRFTTVNGTARNRVARVNPDGTLDTAFQNGAAGADGDVNALALEPGGDVVTGGAFTSMNATRRDRVARLVAASGALDATFPPVANGVDRAVNALALQPDGRIVLVGSFTAFDGAQRRSFVRLDPFGALESGFLAGLAGANNQARALAIQPDGKILVGGEFTTVHGTSRNRIARLNADGTLDTTFLNALSGASSTVQTIVRQPDGKVLLGGSFTTVNGVARNFIARLNATGTLDTTFLNGLSGANNSVEMLVLQPDGRVLVGGRFTTMNGTTRNRIARLNADGTLDATFANALSGANGTVNAVALQPDGKVVLVGDFSTVNGTARSRIARLNADGTLDTTFMNGLAGANNTVYALALQPDGRVVLGGDFTTVHAVARSRIARLNANGTLDVSFAAGVAGADTSVFALALQPDGRVVVAGSFGAMNGGARSFVARVYGAAPTAPTISVEPSSVVTYDGCCASFTVEVSGTPVDYQWRKDGETLVDGPGVSGTNAATLRLTGVDDDDEATYSVVVSNVLGSDTSADAPLTPVPVPVCKVASCDPVLGCVLSNATDGTACNDGDSCTTGDSCLAGTCAGTPNTLTFHQDADGDRYGNPAVTITACFAPAGYVASSGDCDDTDAAVRPGAVEACDAKRNDCSAADWPALLDDDLDGTENSCESCADADADGWGDPGTAGNTCAPDNCPSTSNADQADPDYDGRGTACDVCPLDPRDDEDADGVCGNVDNCPQTSNAGQADADSDGLGDACDPCPDAASTGSTDLDKDGIADACDPDVDGDGILNESDVNDDADSIPDDDGDGVFDPCADRVTTGCDDNCPLDKNPSQRDRDGDRIGDACDPSDDMVQGGSARRSNPPSRSPAGDAAIYTFAWEAESGAIAYKVYAGTIVDLRAGSTGFCYRNRIETTYTTLDQAPSPGTAYFYLVASVYLDREGSLGDRSNGTSRPPAAACP